MLISSLSKLVESALPVAVQVLLPASAVTWDCVIGNSKGAKTAEKFLSVAIALVVLRILRVILSLSYCGI